MNLANDREKPVLVTGANGFVGRYVIDALEQAGIYSDRIFGMCQSNVGSERVPNPLIQDLLDFSGLQEMLVRLNPCAIIHLAAVAMPREAAKDRDRAWQINFDATRVIAETILENKLGTRLVFAGSSEAYGSSFNRSPSPIMESASLEPMSVYGATKAAADMLLGQMQAEGLEVVRFRAFNHSGPGQTIGYVIPDFVHQIVNIERKILPPRMQVGNLSAMRDFLDVRDVAQAYVLALTTPSSKLPKSAINVSSGSARSIEAVLNKLLTFSSEQIEIEISGSKVRRNDVPYAAGDNACLKTALDWRPNFDFETTLNDIINHVRSKAD